MGQRKGYDFAAAVGLRPHQRGHDKLGQYRHDSFKIQGVRYGQMNVETEKNRDYHQLRRCIELQIEMHRAPIRAKHPSHHPDCPLHGKLAHC